MQVPPLDRSTPFMDDIVVSKDGVTNLLKGLNPSKSLGSWSSKRANNRVRLNICSSFSAIN